MVHFQKRTRAPSPNRRAPIKWSDNHWLTIAKMLHQQHPELDLLNPENHPLLPGLKVTQFTEAMAASLPPSQHRPLNSVTVFREKLSQILKQLSDDPAMLDHEFPLQLEEPEPQEAKSFPLFLDRPIGTLPVPAPAEPKDADQRQMAAALTKELKKRKVFWTREEWIEVARQLHLQRPDAKLYMTLLSGLSLEELNAAQRVLPQERRRHLGSVSQVRQQLLDAMHIVRREIEDAQQEAAAERERIEQERAEERRQQAALHAPGVNIDGPRQPAPEAPPAAIPVQDIPAQPPAPAAAPVASVAPATHAPYDELTMRVAAAISPFIKLIAAEFAKQIAPTVEDAVLNMLTMPGATVPVVATMPVVEQPAATVQPEQPVAAMETVPPAEPEQKEAGDGPDEPDWQPQWLATEHRSEHHDEDFTQPPVPKVAVLTHGGKQLQDLKDAFPHIDFVFIDRPGTLKSAVETCDKIIGLENHANQAAREILKKVDRKRWTLLHGGITTIKRHIQTWISTGELRIPHHGSLV
jgi:hypothetical protein